MTRTLANRLATHLDDTPLREAGLALARLAAHFDGLAFAEPSEEMGTELFKVLLDAKTLLDTEDLHQVLLRLEIKVAELAAWRTRAYVDNSGARTYWHPLEQPFRAFSRQHPGAAIVIRETGEAYPPRDVIRAHVRRLLHDAARLHD